MNMKQRNRLKTGNYYNKHEVLFIVCACLLVFITFQEIRLNIDSTQGAIEQIERVIIALLDL